VVQAFAFTKYLGYLNLEFDDEGNVVEVGGSPILLDGTIKPDPEVLELLEKYRPGILDLENEIVGTTKVLLDGSCRRNECNLGNLIADAFIDWRSANHRSDDFWTDAAIAFIQSGSIRSSISKAKDGRVTREDVATVLPFTNNIQIVEITGETILRALEHSVARYTNGEPRGEFLQMSGVEVVYDMNRPVGERVVEAQVRCARCMFPALEPIDESKLYRVILQDFLANGGDGFNMFVGQSIQKIDIRDLEVLVKYFKKKSPVHPSIEGRINIEQLFNPSQASNAIAIPKIDRYCKKRQGRKYLHGKMRKSFNNLVEG
jgi:5'-nucleotidase